MFKKIFSLLLALALLASFSAAALAADFTDSATAKAAPEIATVTNAAGQQVAAIITDANGNEVGSVVTLTVTPVSQVSQARSAIATELNEAYTELNNTDLTTLVPALDAAVKSLDPDLSVNDLVVRDLFDVSLSAAEKELLAASGNSIAITFKLNLPTGTALLVLHKAETAWEMIPNENVTRNADGSVTVEFDSLSPVAFLTESTALPAPATTAPTSPQTGDSQAPLLWTVSALTALCLAALTMALRKQAAR